jgi:hypothetical protein
VDCRLLLYFRDTKHVDCKLILYFRDAKRMDCRLLLYFRVWIKIETEKRRRKKHHMFCISEIE